MRRTPALLVVVGGLVAAQGVGVDTAAATASCVQVASECHRSLADALAAAEDGDTVQVPAGTFPGGVHVTRDITLVGAGAEQTVLSGGGPVLTIGTVGAESQPTVTLRGITLADGRTTSSAVDGVDHVAAGGGLSVLPSAGGRRGGTVTVADSVIRDNRAEPAGQLTQRDEPGVPMCPTGPCPFAAARGGGVDNWGDLTLQDTVVTGNTAAGELTSDAVGGGISTAAGSLTLDHATVSGNRALAGVPWGRFAEGGGIFQEGGTSVTLQHSSVSGNESRLVTELPSVLDDGTRLEHQANGGGMHVGDASTVTIESSHLDGNVTSVVAPHAEDGAFNSALQMTTGTLVVHDSTVDGNTLTADLASAPMFPGTAFQWGGTATITGSEFTDNVTTVTAREGDATAGATVAALAIPIQGAGGIQPSLLERSSISDNTVTVVAPHGDATVLGGGLVHDGDTVLRHVRVTGNQVVAESATATLQGGGIWNGAFQGVAPEPPSRLSLVRSVVAENVLAGPDGAVLEGGGLYSEVPVTLWQTRVEGNVPDDCVGC